MKNLLLTIILFACLNVQALSNDSAVETSGFIPAHIRPDSITTYKVSLKNISGRVLPSDIPLPSGLQIVGQSSSQNYIINNGAASRSTDYTFSITAKKEGDYSMPAWKLKINNREFDIPAAVLKVSQDAPQAPQMSDDDDIFSMPFQMMRQRQIQGRQQQHTYESSLRDKIHLELEIPKGKIYVGQAIPCRLIFSFDKSLAESGLQLQQLLPQSKKVDDFDCTPFGKANEDLSGNGKISYSFDTVITPLKVGNYKLDFSAEGVFLRNASINDMMNMSFADRFAAFGMRQQIPFQVNMPDKTLEVLPLPAEGKPQSFNGAIGKFSLAKTNLDTDALSVGEPCIITAEIIGSGNFNRVGAPQMEKSEDWKTYKPKSSFRDESNAMGYVGIKTFTFTLVPQKADLKNTPTIEFSYFDPVTEKYVVLNSKPIPVSVAPSGISRKREKQAEQTSEPAFGAIVEKSNATASYRIFSSPVFWGSQIVAIAAIAFFIVIRRRNIRIQNDPAFAKFLNSTKKADELMKDALTSANNTDAPAFFNFARESIQCAVASHTDLDAPAILSKEAESDFLLRGADEKILKGIREIFSGADAIAFGNMEISDADLQRLADTLRQIIAFSKKSNN